MMVSVYSGLLKHDVLLSTGGETIPYRYFVRGLLYDIQNAYLSYLEGRLDEEYWETRAAVVLAYLAQPAAREIYETDRSIGNIDSRFLLWIEQNQ